MSGHLIGCAGSLEHVSVEGKQRKLPTSHKLALLAFADSADDRTHIGFAGYAGVQKWAVCSRARAAELIRDLCAWGLLEQHATARPGRRAEYVVFPGGCCDLHRPADVEETPHDVEELARAAGVDVDQARRLLAAMNGSDASDTSPRNGSDASDPSTSETPTTPTGPVDNHESRSERVQNGSDTPDPSTTSTTSPQPPTSRGSECSRHPNSTGANCRRCGTTPRQQAAAARKAADAQRRAADQAAAKAARDQRTARAAAAKAATKSGAKVARAAINQRLQELTPR